MSKPTGTSDELRSIVALRESTKCVAVRAFQVNLLGLNAILLAKQFGERARGFGVISNELRDFSQALREQMAGLRDNCAILIELTARQLRLARQNQLLAHAALAKPDHALMASARARQEAEGERLYAATHNAHSEMNRWVEAAYQSCLFGTVIARSAKIEAAHAGAGGESLTNASNDFSEHVNQILPSLAQMRQALHPR